MPTDVASDRTIFNALPYICQSLYSKRSCRIERFILIVDAVEKFCSKVVNQFYEQRPRTEDHFDIIIILYIKSEAPVSTPTLLTQNALCTSSLVKQKYPQSPAKTIFREPSRSIRSFHVQTPWLRFSGSSSVHIPEHFYLYIYLNIEPPLRNFSSIWYQSNVRF